MTGLMMQVRKEIPAFRKADYGLENALAKYVRARWPDKTVVHVAAHWRSLSEAEALKVVYGTASKNTLNKLLHDKRGGAALFIELVCDATSTSLEDYITRQAREAADERTRWEAEERRLAILQARVSRGRGLDGPDDQPPRPRGSAHEGVGPGAHGRAVDETKSFRPPGRT